jgi:hypothetical protein
MSKPATTERTRGDLKDLFFKWGIKDYSIIREQKEFTNGVMKRGNGATVSYLRKNGWQTVTCVAGDNYAENLRRIFLFLDRIRLGEKQGVAYQGLSSSREIVKTSVDPKVEEAENLADAYDFLGVKPSDPFDLIEKVYKGRANYFAPDKPTGSEAMMKRLNNSFDLIKQARGEK